MNDEQKAQLQRDFLPKEIVLQLYRDIARDDYSTKISVVSNYANTLTDTWDCTILNLRLNNEIAFFFWDAEEYPMAIQHYLKVVEVLKPEDYPSLYFFIIGQLIRCNRHILNFSESLKWADLAFSQINHTHSSFEKLNILKEYVDLLEDSKEAFSIKYIPVITTVIEDLGFPEVLEDPKVTVNSMKDRNKFWNRKMSKITLMDRNNPQAQIEALEEFQKTCEIGWYKNFAAEMLQNRS